jgi:acylphosphatase
MIFQWIERYNNWVFAPTKEYALRLKLAGWRQNARNGTWKTVLDGVDFVDAIERTLL